MKTKETKGITLIALVVTITVMLILAGITISISMLNGESSIIFNVNKAKIEQKKSQFEEEAKLIYSEKNIEKNIEKNETGKSITFKAIKTDLENKGYEISEKIINEVNGSKNILLNQEIISLEVGQSKYLDVKREYYVKIESKYYKIKLNNGEVKLSDENYEIKDKENFDNDIQVSSDNSNLYAKMEEDRIYLEDKAQSPGNYTIAITYGAYVQNFNVAVVIKPPETRKENYNLNIGTNYGKIDIIWLDNNNNVLDEPNKPILTSNGESMVPIIWNDKNNIEKTNENDGNWYNYNECKWANAKTINDSYFVWIPRYAYRIVYYTDATYSEITGFWDGLGFWKASTGESRGNVDEGIRTIDYNGDKYVIHPAFETELETGGWENELSGIWVSKFEISEDGTDLKSTYGVKSLRNKTIGEQYKLARNGKYGFNGSQDDDNNTSYMYSHMIKNSEWGATAYLSYSIFGRNTIKIEKDAQEQYTGGGANTAYIQNVNKNTTGNVYGIYDLVGGARESVALFNCKDDNNYFETSNWTKETNLTVNSNSTKYATKYRNDTQSSEYISTLYKYTKIGDGIKEVRINSNRLAWDGGYLIINNSKNPFLTRGGVYSTDTIVCGIFYANAVSGENVENLKYIALRTVLCP